MQVKNEYEAKNKHLEEYRDTVCDSINSFEAFSITAVPREENDIIDTLAVLASTWDPCREVRESKLEFDILFKHFFPDNHEHWQVFPDDAQVYRFMNNLGKFEKIN